MGKNITQNFKILVARHKTPDTQSLGNDSFIKENSIFSRESREIVGSILKMQELINTYKDRNRDIRKHKSYILDENKDTDMERIVNNVMNTSFDKLARLKNKCDDNLNSQQIQHREIVCDSIMTYLKKVCQSFVQERTLRAQRVMDHMDISRLQKKHYLEESTLKYKIPSSKSKHIPKTALGTTDLRHRHKNRDDLNGSEGVDGRNRGDSSNATPAGGSFPPTYKNYTQATEASDTEDCRGQEDFTKEEVQEFEEENDRMYQEFTSSLNEIQSIEKKMVEVSRLQDVLTENLLTQEEGVDSLAFNTVNTTENVKQANVELLEALQHKAGFRVWILFILIVLTFSLLFLDWYNP